MAEAAWMYESSCCTSSATAAGGVAAGSWSASATAKKARFVRAASSQAVPRRASYWAWLVARIVWLRARSGWAR